MFLFILVGLFAIFYFVEHFFTPYGRRHSTYRNDYTDNRPYNRRERYRYQDPYERDYYPRERYPYHDDHYYYRDRYRYEGRGGGSGAFMVLLGIAGIAFLFFKMADANEPINAQSSQQEQYENYPLKQQSLDGSFVPNEETPKSATDQVIPDNYESKTTSQQNKNIAPGKRMKPQKVSSISHNVRNSQLLVEKKIYYVQLSTAQVLRKADNRAEELEEKYPGQIQIAKDIEATNLAYKILCGPFTSKYAAKAAVGDSSAFVRSKLEENLIFYH